MLLIGVGAAATVGTDAVGDSSFVTPTTRSLSSSSIPGNGNGDGVSLVARREGTPVLQILHKQKPCSFCTGRSFRIQAKYSEKIVSQYHQVEALHREKVLCVRIVWQGS